MQELRTYRVAHDDFFSFAAAPELKESFDMFYQRCKEPMRELIEMYGLHSKRVLSVGSSLGYEEYCFYENGCSLTFCDIDEHETIEPYLKKLQDSGERDTLTYFVGDAANLINVLDNRFDIYYVSSFTPNELRNRFMKRVYRMPYLGRFLDKTIGRLGMDFLYRGLWSWPQDKDVLMDLVIKIADSALDHEGIFVYQSYASGVDARDSRYVESICRQLESIGIYLLTVYYFKNYPNIHLVIGFRGHLQEAMKFMNKVLDRKALSAFHGRSLTIVDPGGIGKAYELSPKIVDNP